MDVPFLSSHVVDRRTTDRADEAALDRAWTDPSTRLLSINRAGRILFRDGALVSRATASAVRPADAFYLGHDGRGHWFAEVVDVHDDPQARDDRAIGLRAGAEQLEPADVALFVHAFALLNWHESHRFCPRCGAPTVSTQGGHVRVCTRDGSQHFPRTDPAVIMLITDPAGQQALLGRKPTWSPGQFSCLAGFVEPGESAEHAVVRETREETAVDVSGVRYVASQPWPFPASLMLGYRAVADPTQPVDVGHDELAAARWFSRQEIADAVAAGTMLPGAVSIARFMIEAWLAES